MAGKSRRSKLVLADEDRAALEQITRSRTVAHRESQRAAILLGYHAGESVASISRRIGMTRLSVSKWVAKALAVGPMAALKDNYHRPKEPVIGDDAKAWVVHVACSKPKDLGYAAEVWSRHALATHIREHAVEAGFPALSRTAKATVHRILAEQPLHPEKVKYYLERRDPDFESGMRKVLIVYQDVALQNARRAAGQTVSNIVTVSVDDKPGVQAIGTTAPDSAACARRVSRNQPRSRIQETGHLFDPGRAGSPGWSSHGACGGPSPQCRIYRPAVGSERKISS